MTWLDKTLSAVGLQRQTKAAPLPAHSNLDAMSAQQLEQLGHELGRQQEAIRDRRRVIARAMEAKLAKKEG